MAGDRGRKWRSRILPLSEGSRVTRLELFFDLVFVFAFLNVTKLMAEDLTGRGLIRGVLLLALLWWCWAPFAWIGNIVRIDQASMPTVLFAAMAAILVVAVMTPETFIDRPGGIVGPLVFPVCYLFVRGLHLTVARWASREMRAPTRWARYGAVPVLVATALLTGAALVSLAGAEGHLFAVRVALWTLAIAVEYGWALLVGVEGWRVVSAGHWSERFALIVIVALGESIISIGGTGDVLQAPAGWLLIGAAIAGIAVTASLWWLYFDFIALAADQALHHADGPERARLARDAYILLHLPMVAGIILFALGVREVLQHVTDPAVRDSQNLPLQLIDSAVLFGGVLLFLLGHLAFQLRMLGTVTWTRVSAILLLAVLILASRWAPVPAPVSLVVLAAVCVGLVLVENRLFAGSRRAVRKAVLQEHRAHEARETAWRRRHR